jgi:NAD(P)-dependent dehydrogenase (short-subunit alcohol dehydrogenase family)
MEIQNRHALITGAARRVARRIAERLLERGAKVTAHYHASKKEAETLVDQFGKDNVFLVPADLRDMKALARLVCESQKYFGPIDILVNSASDFYPTPALEVTEEQWDHLFSLNLKAQFFLAQGCGKEMKARGGVILNIADVNGERPMKKYAPYSATKAGLLMMTRSLALEWAPEVRVNSLSPGAVLLPENYTEAQRQRSIERSLLKRLGSPDDIAEGAMFLIQNPYITGFDLKVDGGRSLA